MKQMTLLEGTLKVRKKGFAAGRKHILLIEKGSRRREPFFNPLFPVFRLLVNRLAEQINLIKGSSSEVISSTPCLQ
jgi:hypothetical protein